MSRKKPRREPVPTEPAPAKAPTLPDPNKTAEEKTPYQPRQRRPPGWDNGDW